MQGQRRFASPSRGKGPTSLSEEGWALGWLSLPYQSPCKIGGKQRPPGTATWPPGTPSGEISLWKLQEETASRRKVSARGGRMGSRLLAVPERGPLWGTQAAPVSVQEGRGLGSRRGGARRECRWVRACVCTERGQRASSLAASEACSFTRDLLALHLAPSCPLSRAGQVTAC